MEGVNGGRGGEGWQGMEGVNEGMDGGRGGRGLVGSMEGVDVGGETLTLYGERGMGTTTSCYVIRILCLMFETNLNRTRLA